MATEDKTGMKELTADVNVIKNSLGVVEGMSFGKLIGGPLEAGIAAQANAAKSTLDFIRAVGLKESEGKQQFVKVEFEFIRNGKAVKLRIPLLTLVPIPSLCIHDMNYKFTVKVDSFSQMQNTWNNESAWNISIGIPIEQPETDKDKESASADKSTKPDAATENKKEAVSADGKNQQAADAAEKAAGEETSKKDTVTAKEQLVADGVKSESGKQTTGFSVSLSSKKDSKATRDSKYSVEATMEVTVNAVKDDLPGGILKILEVLNEAVEVVEPESALTGESKEQSA